MLRSPTLKLSTGLIKTYQRCATTTSSASTLEKISEDVQDPNSNELKATKKSAPSAKVQLDPKISNNTGKSHLVTSAFASLSTTKSYDPILSPLDESIMKAKTTEELLALSLNSMLTKRQAIKIVTTLSEWPSNLKGDDYHLDPRFASLCQMIGKDSYPKAASWKEGDLSVVLGIMGEDEAAKMINSISLPQMIKVLSSLSFKKRRSIPLLKALAFNISCCTSKLDIKQSADILYAVASLNFPDEVLLEKVCSDLLETVPNCKKSAVIGSICTSLGFLRYKDTELINSLCSWTINNKSIARHQDFVSLVLCLASVNYSPNKELIEIFLTNIFEDDLPSAATWLDVVWALAVLESAPEGHISSILKPKFIERLSKSSASASTSWKRKLLNINGLAKVTKGYKGPFLEEGPAFEVPNIKSKDKQNLFTSMVDTLSNLFPSTNHFRISVDTGMGFLIDAECMFDQKMNPIPLVDKKTGQPVQLNGKRIAILIHDYHDCTRGHVEPCGAAVLHASLIKKAGYTVIPLLYTNYNPQSKLLERAKCIDGLLKSVATTPPV